MIITALDPKVLSSTQFLINIDLRPVKESKPIRKDVLFEVSFR